MTARSENEPISAENERHAWGPAGVASDPDFRRPTTFAQAPERSFRYVHEVMTRKVETLHPDNTLEQAAEKMKKFDIGPLPVCEGDKLVGIITDRDIIIRSVSRGEDPTMDRVRHVMTPGTICCCFQDQEIGEAARLMHEKQVDQLPVISRDNRLVGIVTMADLAMPGKR